MVIVCDVVSAARIKKKKGPGDKKVAGQAVMPKMDSKKLDSDIVSDLPEYVNIKVSLCCFSVVLNCVKAVYLPSSLNSHAVCLLLPTIVHTAWSVIRILYKTQLKQLNEVL